ncbi:MAG TPA: VOC family protein [Dehalococcoidia bacterium]|nr:VOC family protein [Dehalococcoidia bacterium]
MTLRIATVTIDCADPAPIARWWAEALGWRVAYEDDDECVIEPPEGGESAAPLLFIRVPDAKTVKNRIHLDLRPEDRDAEVARLEGLGAKRINVGQGEDVTWVVMSDPFGNEFCVLRALTPEERASEQN